jgi:hypothetical protein
MHIWRMLLSSVICAGSLQLAGKLRPISALAQQECAPAPQKYNACYTCHLPCQGLQHSLWQHVIYTRAHAGAWTHTTSDLTSWHSATGAMPSHWLWRALGAAARDKRQAGSKHSDAWEPACWTSGQQEHSGQMPEGEHLRTWLEPLHLYLPTLQHPVYMLPHTLCPKIPDCLSPHHAHHSY